MSIFTLLCYYCGKRQLFPPSNSPSGVGLRCCCKEKWISFFGNKYSFLGNQCAWWVVHCCVSTTTYAKDLNASERPAMKRSCTCSHSKWTTLWKQSGKPIPWSIWKQRNTVVFTKCVQTSINSERLVRCTDVAVSKNRQKHTHKKNQ